MLAVGQLWRLVVFHGGVNVRGGDGLALGGLLRHAIDADPLLQLRNFRSCFQLLPHRPDRPVARTRPLGVLAFRELGVGGEAGGDERPLLIPVEVAAGGR